jgi:type II secretory pathway pseudopilin PulG
MKNKTKNKKFGFTLIETFVAITILMIVVLGPMALLSNALQDARFIGDEITATYLAQEGVEIMIDDRNNNGGPNVDIAEQNSCTLDLETDFSSDNGYNCLGPTETNIETGFTRLITITSMSAPNQFKITSVVSFSRPNFPSRNIESSSIIWGG